eukprot:UN32664
MLKFNTNFSPNITIGKDGYYMDKADQINHFIEQAIRQSNAVDTEVLNILTGEKVWYLNCTINITDDYGNVLDCVFLAAISALRSHRRPDVTVVGSNVTIHPVAKRPPVALSFQYVPLAITLGFLENEKDKDNPYILVDPTLEEEQCLDGLITYAIDTHGTILAVQKVGGIPLTIDKLDYAMRLCHSNVCKLTE